MSASIHRAALGVCLAVAAGPTLAADPPAAAASAPNEEVPFCAVGMPKGNKLAPVPSFPIATPVDQSLAGRMTGAHSRNYLCRRLPMYLDSTARSVVSKT